MCGTPITVEKPVGKSEYVWEDTIQTNVRETIYENVEWIKLSPDKLKTRIFVNITRILQKKERVHYLLAEYPTWAPQIDNLLSLYPAFNSATNLLEFFALLPNSNQIRK